MAHHNCNGTYTIQLTGHASCSIQAVPLSSQAPLRRESETDNNCAVNGLLITVLMTVLSNTLITRHRCIYLWLLPTLFTAYLYADSWMCLNINHCVSRQTREVVSFGFLGGGQCLTADTYKSCIGLFMFSLNATTTCRCQRVPCGLRAVIAQRPNSSSRSLHTR